MPVEPQQFRAVAKGVRGQMYFYGNIGNSILGPGISSEDVASELGKFQNVTELDIYIHSYGGSPFEAIAIYNMLLRLRARITAHVDSMAASAASIITMAGDTIRMAENSILMIHEAKGEVFGSAEDMRRGAEALDTVTDVIIQTYASRRGIDPAKVREWVMDETWFNSANALSAGMIDNITAPTKIAAFIPPEKRILFNNIPETLCNAADPSDGLDVADQSPSNSIAEGVPAPTEQATEPDPPVELTKRAVEFAKLNLTATAIRQHSAPVTGRNAAATPKAKQ